ncbi:MAG: hypothetical protein AMXMBFR60_15230 [Chloroflexota bacterium]|nr:hypothetical protein [Anaerolineales bacterium]NUQ60580.1 hypothetical protein [Anaerolineales bacterium]
MKSSEPVNGRPGTTGNGGSGANQIKGISFSVGVITIPGTACVDVGGDAVSANVSGRLQDETNNIKTSDIKFLFMAASHQTIFYTPTA